MQSVIDFLLVFGVVFGLVLFGMLAYMKLAHKRVESSPEERQAKASYMADAPSDAQNSRGPGGHHSVGT